jgi:gp178
MEDWTRVLLYGTFDGFTYSTDDLPRIVVVLDDGERVEVPKECVISADQMVNKNKIKLKDVIALIKSIDLDSQEVWLNEILNELGSDYGSLKYRAGYEQGRFDGAMEREKVTVPQFIADWIKKCKTFEHLISLSFALNPISWKENRLSDECIDWLKSTSNQEVFARAWIDGYTVEKEPKYTVKIKSVNQYLVRNTDEDFLGFLQSRLKSKFTRKELEDVGLGEVFNSSLFEVEEEAE